MKIFAFIMAFIVLALSVMPCADKGNGVNDGKEKSSFVKSNHQADDQQQDDCSPFCQCSCCAGFSLSQMLTVISQPPFILSNPEARLISSDLFSIALPIWQPPQLV